MCKPKEAATELYSEMVSAKLVFRHDSKGKTDTCIKLRKYVRLLSSDSYC